jgi:hypothetical protein
MAWISIYDAAAKMRDELIEAQRRIDAGEPFNTTAADLGYTPGELRELFEAQQTQQRERAYKDKWRAIYDNDLQDLY